MSPKTQKNELSDCHDSDDDWHNDEFKNLKQISQTAFDVMIENTKVLISFTNKCLLFYIGNSKRTQRRKKLAAKTVTAGIFKLDTFFSISQQIPHQSIKKFANNLKQFERDQE
ncbi:6223_t:CDS:2 [Funneliformis caledonium]|uniref:6223_t:CDS:1 n=1 Tax=Funneliformis caledonium TaxID=1117310 RepID=A0A9N9GUQ2_9GLOM|nr:6223_t:CDS:2 [Funneliformis caledonium]